MRHTNLCIIYVFAGFATLRIERHEANINYQGSRWRRLRDYSASDIIYLYMNLRTQVLSGLRWKGGAIFLSQLCTWGVTLVVMRILSPTDYGLLAIAGIFVSFLALLSELGMGPVIIQKADIDENDLRQIFGVSLLINSVLSVMLFLVAPLIATFYDESRLTLIVRVMAFQFILNAFVVVPQSFLIRKLAFKSISILEVIGNILTSIATLVAALNGLGVWSLVVGNYVNIFLKVVGINFISPFIKLPKFSFRGIRRSIIYGGNVTLTRVLWFFYSQADVFIAGKLLGTQQLGFYTVSMNLATLPLQKISGIVNLVAFPAFAQIQNNMELVRSHFLKAVRGLSAISFPILWGISSVSPELVNVFLGEKWLSAIIPLQIVTLIMPLTVINNMFNPLIQGIGHPEVSLQNVIRASIIMPAAFVIGSYWGIKGLSFAWLLAYPFVFYGNLLRLKELIGLESVNLVFKEILRPVLASFVMYSVVIGIKSALAANLTLKITLVALIISGASAYLMMMLIFFRASFKEVMRFLHG